MADPESAPIWFGSFGFHVDQTLSSLELLGSLLLHQNMMQAAMTGLEVAQSTTSGHQVGWRWGWRNVENKCSKISIQHVSKG